MQDELISVLICDDSALMRAVLRKLFETDSRFKIVGEAVHGGEGIEMAQKLKPRVITMDLEMPEVNGLQAIEEIMARSPTRILVLTSQAHYGGSDSRFEALSRGALELLLKPENEEDRGAILQVAARLAAVPVIPHVRRAQQHRKRGRADAQTARIAAPPSIHKKSLKVIGIGASTGGPRVLRSILSELPGDFKIPVVIVQHMYHAFASGFTDWLNEDCPLSVERPSPGAELLPGHVYVASYGPHVMVGSRGELRLTHTEPRNGHRPSVDVLFESIASSFRSHGMGVLLTGMGRDGADGLKAIRDAGGPTIVQNESSSVVFGMPKAAIEADAGEYVVHSDEIADHILQLCRHARGAP